MSERRRALVSNARALSVQVDRLLAGEAGRVVIREARTQALGQFATGHEHERGLGGHVSQQVVAGRLRWEAEAAFLPPELLVRRDGGLGVFLIYDGAARFHPLPEATEGQPARVDLPAEARLVLEGRQRLSDGDAVVPARD